MVDWAIANGFACVDCGRGRCICDMLEHYDIERARQENRTNRLMMAIELTEDKIARIEDENEYHPALPELRERRDNLNRALLNHRRAVHKLET
jgi:hypothetical protein